MIHGSPLRKHWRPFFCVGRLAVQRIKARPTRQTMEKTLKFLSAFDWALSSGTLVVGLYLQNWLIVGAGCLGLLVAWYGPAARLKAYLATRFLRKTVAVKNDSSAVAQDDTFYAQALPAEAPVAAADYSRPLPAGRVFLHSSPFNRLKPPHLQLEQRSDLGGWA